MPKKSKKKEDDPAPKQLEWDEFLEIKDKYIGNLVELVTSEGTYAGELTKIVIGDTEIICFYCQKCFIYTSTDGWQEHQQKEFILFKVDASGSNPVDLTSGTIEIIIHGHKTAYLKLRKPPKRAI